jgi:hypothetical protein
MRIGRVWLAAGMAALMAAPAVARGQLLDFAQVDVAEDTQTVVLARALRLNDPQRPDPLITAGYTRWDTGSTAGAGYMHRWALTQGEHRWLVGAGAGANTFRSRGSAAEEEEDGLSLRAQTELSGPAPGGRYYGLVQVSTFRDQFFGLLQYDLAKSRLGFELSALSETGHRQRTAAVRLALDEKKRWFLRGGAITTLESDETQAFVGLAFNGF